ncbi:MAG: PKD domain-containing protein [Acidobacteriota bacterium]
MSRSLLGSLLPPLVFLLAACNSGNPVAPDPPGGNEPPAGLQVTVAASPARINAGSATPSTVTITAKTAAGVAAPNGSEVTITTSLGSFAQAAEPQRTVKQLLNGGTAQVFLYAGDATGTANLLAEVGASVGRGSVTVAEPPLPNQAEFTFVANGLSVTFTDSSTGSPTSWNWDFGDTQRSSDRNPVHQYSVAGTYTVTLTVGGPGGTSARQKFVALTTGPPIGASFDFEIDPANSLKVQFFDRSTGDPTLWTWDFGDMTTSGARNPQHTYTTVGTFTVTLTTSNAFSSGSISRFVSTQPPPPVAAAFDYELDPANSLKVQFFDRSTGDPTKWTWRFGDDSSSTERNPNHTYAAGATYTVTLEASNAFSLGTVSRFVNTVTAPPPAPTADFDWAASGRVVQFVNKSSSGASLQWDFGDNTAVSTEQNPKHTYAVAGTYPVALKATNAGGSATANKIVQTDPAPVANFTFSQDGTTVFFVDQSTNAPTTWRWNFGDGNLSFEQNPAHTYAQNNRTYTISLEVTNAAGSNSIIKQVVIP